MTPKAYLSLAGFVAILGFSSNTFSQDSDVIGCWRVEKHVSTLTDGSTRQEKDRCVQFFDDGEISVACNSIRDPDYRSTQPYEVIKQQNGSVLSFGKDPYRLEKDYEIRKGEMVITTRYQRPRKISPNELATSRTSILTRLKFADREACLSQAKLIPIEAIKPAELAPGVIDFPKPLFKTKIDVAEFGSIRWLDTDHVAVTASAAVPGFGRGKVVSLDLRNKSITTIAESGILRCTNPEAALVALTKGEVKVVSDSPPEERLYRWDSTKNALVDEVTPPKPSGSGRYWNWDICTQTTLEDAKKSELHFLKTFTGKAYLRPEDGVLNWSSSPPPPEGFPVSLVTPRGVSKPLSLKSHEIIGIPTYFPFLKGYVLSGGRFITGGGKIDYAGDKVEQIPLVTLRHDGTVNRSYIPPSLNNFLEKWKNTVGQIYPAANGLLVYVGGFVHQGAGIYLTKGDSATRIWCSPLDHSDDDCALSTLEISPDGCNAIIVPRKGFSKSPVILPICSKT